MMYREAMQYIQSANQYGSVLGLNNIVELLKRLDNPQESLQFVHIGGTNGKGSVAAYLSFILAESGYHVGRYISPVIFEYRERIQQLYSEEESKISLNTAYISEVEVVKHIEQIQAVILDMTKDGLPHPTPFEIETAMAFLAFVDWNCDIVVLEVGLGGRLDATNVINNVLCTVIASISMDHMQFLGDTIEKIAFEKAGIIKKGRPVISYEQTAQAKKVIQGVCYEKGAFLTCADFSGLTMGKLDLEGTEFKYKASKESCSMEYRIRLLGLHQVKNAALAIETAKVLQQIGCHIHQESIVNGLAHTIWRGRLEILSTHPIVMVDGAHNADAAKELGDNLKIYFKNKKIFGIMGVLADKDYDSILAYTCNSLDTLFTITPKNDRALDSATLAKVARNYYNEVVDAKTVEEAMAVVIAKAEKEDVILVFGSLSFLEEIYTCMEYELR